MQAALFVDPVMRQSPVADDGALSVWGGRWIETERDLFVRDDGRRLLGFIRDANGEVDAMSGGP